VLRRRDYAELGELMKRNFDLRRELFGDAALGEHTIALVGIARELGFPSKLPGSSGAALILLNGKHRDAETELARAYEARGYGFAVIRGR
jgi:glucuronokinase